VAVNAACVVVQLIWLLLYLISVSFLVLAFHNSCYRERFKRIFHIRGSWDMGSEQCKPWDDVSVSTQPTAKPVAVGDLAGRWQFYLDAAGQTVKIELRSDGTFGQTIVANRGGTWECAGGIWRLEGALVHLDGYFTAAEGRSGSCTWQVIDIGPGFGLYGGKDPDAQPSIFIHRQP
jgi:hypothetical protein